MEKYENRNNPITYLVWVLLWVNAIKDSYLWIDSPDCFFFKNDFVQWNHDITSKLRQADWNHKFLSTISDANNVSWNRNDKFLETLKHIGEQDFVKQIFVSSMPMNQIVWTDYDWIIKEVKKWLKKDKPIFNIPSRSMTDCWLEWYSDLLFSLAKNIDIEGSKQEKNNIAIVWNLFDRWEGDCIWNVQELKRIIEWLWLTVVSIWLDWWDYSDVLNIKNAGTIISLPYGRKAAKKIANRLDVDLIELDLPFWLDKTWEFIRTIWNHFWIIEKAEDIIKKELTEINKIDIIKWVIPHTFIWKKVSYFGDPYLLMGIIDLSKTLWFEVTSIFIHWEEKHFPNNIDNIIDWTIPIKSWFEKWDSIDWIDLFITNSHIMIWENSKIKTMEIWFPSYNYHLFTFEPYFWYKWTIIFINRMANILNS
jgi:nitrogenase molybdenum-iron protein alpha/beta subunit